MVSPDDCFGSKRGVRTGCLHTFDKTSEETASKNTSPQRHGDKICCASSEAHSLHFFGPLGHCEFPAIFREGMHRVTVAPQHRKESSADAVRRCTQNTLMLPCGSKTVGHAFDIDGHALPASSHRRSRGQVPIRVFCVYRLPTSAMKFLLCCAATDAGGRIAWYVRVAAHASGATPWHGARTAPISVAANGCATFICVICGQRRLRDCVSTQTRELGR